MWPTSCCFRSPCPKLLPLALSKGESEFITPRVTAHLTTNIEVIEKFLPVTIEVEDMGARGGTVRITRPRG
ncbi:MAG: RNA 3'-terminal phosphate cyclase [Planctomycetota bacterium]